MVNKIPEYIDNPIDNILYKIIDTQLDFYKKIGLTPNMITTMSLICGLFSVYLIQNNNYIYGSIFWFLAYYFDCADGKMARKFKMTTTIGDYYDHGSDILKHALMFYVLNNKIKIVEYKNLLVIILIIICILTVIQIGCQEKITRNDKKTESQTLSITEYFVFTDCKTQTKFTRYFTPGTITAYLIIVMLILSKKY
jgi:phosphatidylglycerophosphate synthase